MKIIVDAFGGDNAPLEIIKGCAEATSELDIDIMLTGDEKEIREYKVDQLKFRPKRKKEKMSISDAELKQLEALEKKEGKSKLDDN